MSPLTTIFTGAGSSYDCGVSIPRNPPLGRGLFSELETFAPQIMQQVVDVIGNKNIDDFEAKMHEVVESKKINGIILNAVIASYFSKFQPGLIGNHYSELFNSLRTEEVDYVFSTVNYDCIAELAASGLGINVNYNLDEMISDGFDVLKLHGSCNFVFDGMRGPLGGLSMPITTAGIDGPIKVVQPNQVSTLIQNIPAGPCMSFYMKDKPTPVGKKTITAIQNKWKEMLKQSDNLIIIGTNVNQNDMHIWKPISNVKAKIGFVGRDPAFKALKSLNSNLDVTHIDTDFSTSIQDIVNFVT